MASREDDAIPGHSNVEYRQSSTPRPSRPSNVEYPQSSTPQPSGPSNVEYPQSSTQRPSRPSNVEYPQSSTPRPSGPNNAEYTQSSTPRPSGPSNAEYPQSSTQRPSRPSNAEYPQSSTPRPSGPNNAEYTQSSTPRPSGPSNAEYPQSSTPRSSGPSNAEYPQSSTPRPPVPSNAEYPQSSTPRPSGPSNAEDPQSSTPRPSGSKNVKFDSDESHEGSRQDGAGPQSGGRRQSMVGQSGYVSQLLDETLQDDTVIPSEIPVKNPIRRQSLVERRASVKGIQDDVNFYMRDALEAELSSGLKKKSSSKIKLSTLSSKEKLREVRILATLQPDESRPSSEWTPSALLEEEEVRKKEECSWLGSYVVGKDYWENEDIGEPEKTEQVNLSMEEERQPWYVIPLQKPSLKDSQFRAMKLKLTDKIETLKEEIDEEYEEKRKLRMISAARARQEQKAADEWSDEFKEYFRTVSKSGEFSHRGTHLSLADADKWLEKAGLLDYSGLTLIHTGFCFLSCGGSRHRGLSFDEFTQFLQMISFATGLPQRDIIRKLIASQKTAGK